MTDGQMALCRHCGSKLHQAAGFWVDADGSAVCMRGPDRRKARPDVTMDNSWTISRSKTPEELIEVVVDAERTRRYYHPEDYPEYGDEDIDYK